MPRVFVSKTLVDALLPVADQYASAPEGDHHNLLGFAWAKDREGNHPYVVMHPRDELAGSGLYELNGRLVFLDLLPHHLTQEALFLFRAPGQEGGIGESNAALDLHEPFCEATPLDR